MIRSELESNSGRKPGLIEPSAKRGGFAQPKRKNTAKMKKEIALQVWKAMPENQPILPVMTPVAYKARGSRYGACGIRIDGNPEFVRAVMSRLIGLIGGENHETRLGLAWSVVDGSGIGKVLDNAETGAECCYIRLCERGNEGKIASGIFDRHLDKAQSEFAQAMAV